MEVAPAEHGPEKQRGGRNDEARSGHEASGRSRTAERAAARSSVGSVDDPAEREADRVADDVVRRIGRLDVTATMHDADSRADAAGRIQRAGRTPATESTEPAGAGAASGTSAASGRIQPVSSAGGEIDTATATAISRAQRSGGPLPDPMRSEMESGFGADLSDVRVHAGPDADEASERLGARAFTLGSDVFFRGGMPSTSSTEDRRLVAHELAHTRQQTDRAARRATIHRAVETTNFDKRAVRHYREDVRSTKTWPTVGHLASAATKEGIQVRLFEEDVSDEANPRVTGGPVVGTGNLHHYGLVNTGSSGHWEVLVPATSADANTKKKAKTYVDAVGDEYRIHRLATFADGDCGYDGIHIIKHGAKANPQALKEYRQNALVDYDDEQVRVELVEIYEQYAARRRRLGVDAEGMAEADPMGLTDRIRAVFARLFESEHSAPADASQPSDEHAAQGGSTSTKTNETSKATSKAKKRGTSAGSTKKAGTTGRTSKRRSTKTAANTAQPQIPVLSALELRADPLPGADLPDPARKTGDRAAELRSAAERLKAKADLMGNDFIRTYADEMSYAIMQAIFDASSGEAQDAIGRARSPGKGDDPVALAEEAYRAAQAHYRSWGRHSDKTLTYKSTSAEAEGEAMEILHGDIDLRIARLIPLLDRKARLDPDHFKATLRWLGGGDTPELAARYEVATGTPLDDALATCYGGRHNLRYVYLKQVVDKGKPGPNARLALRLGLLYPRWTPFAWNIGGAVPGVTDKERLREFMRDDPASFRDLVAMAVKKQDVKTRHSEVEKQLKAEKKQTKAAAKKSAGTSAGAGGGSDPEKRFLDEAFLVLDRSGLLGEVAALHSLQTAKAEADRAAKVAKEAAGDTTTTIAEDDGGDDEGSLRSSHIRYLVSLVYNSRREEIRHLRFKPPFHVKHLRHDLVAWVKELAGEEDRELFALAGRAELDGREDIPKNQQRLLDGNRYCWYWGKLRSLNLISVDKSRYVVSVAENQVRVDNGEAAADGDQGGRLGELVATLDLQNAKGTWASKRVERSSMFELARQYLSADANGDFNAVDAIMGTYGDETSRQKIHDAAPAAKPKAISEAFEAAWTRFAAVLSGAGVSDEQRADLRRFVMLRGSTGADGTAEFNAVDNYIALTSHPSRDEAVRLVQALKPDTLEWRLAHRDRILHRYLYMLHGFYNPTGRHLKWKAICAMLDIDADDIPPPAPGETFESIGGTQFDNQLLDDAAVSGLEGQDGHSGLAKYYAGQMLATSRVDRDGNRLLEVAFAAQEDGVPGAGVFFQLSWMNHAVATELWKGKSRWHRARGENTAYGLVGKYLREQRPADDGKAGFRIRVGDLLNASRAVTKLGTDTESRDNAMDQITEKNVLDFADPSAFTALQERSAARLDTRLALFEEQRKKTPDNDRLGQLTEQIDDLTVEIEQLEVGIDKNLEKRLKRVFRDGDFVAQKRRIFLLMGDVIGTGKHGSLEQIHLSEAELRFKGIQTKAKSDLVEMRSLQSTSSWDHRSTASMETAEAEGMLLSSYWTNQRKLHSLATKSSLSKQERATQSKLLDEMAESEKNLRETQEYFRKVQDRLSEQTVKIITTTLSILIAVAGLASGIGAAPGVVQLMWTLGASVLTAMVTQVLKAGFSREGEFSKAEAVKDSLISILSNVITFSVVQELTLMVDLACIGIHTGDTATQLFGKPALALVKGQIDNWLSDIPEGVVNQFFKKKPISNLAPDVFGAFTDKLKAMPAQLFVGYVKAFATESYRMGQKEFFEALGADAAVWTPESSMAGIGATENGNVTQNYNDAMERAAFGGGTLNNQRQFIFGPQEGVGNTSLGGTDNLPAVLGHSLKTAANQELITKQIQQQLGGLAQRGVDVVTAEQTGANVTGPQRPASSDEQETTLTRDAEALRMVCDYFAHIGIRLDGATTLQEAHDAIRAALPESDGSTASTAEKSSKSSTSSKSATKAPTRADRAIDMFDHYHGRVLALLPHSVSYKSGSQYEGQLVKGKRTGQGSYTWPNGDTYVGSWKDGDQNGHGTYLWKDRDMYRGSWKDGEFSGSGVYYWASGGSYTGDFRGDKFHGKGTYLYESGSVYQGDFVDDRFEGTGTYESHEGWTYTGAFANDRFHGVGKKTFTDGSYYEGEFQNDEFHGRGGLFAEDGTKKLVGFWKKGTLSKPFGDVVEVNGSSVVLKSTRRVDAETGLDDALADAKKLLARSSGGPEKRKKAKRDSNTEQPVLL